MRAILLTLFCVSAISFAASGTMKLAGEVKALTADTMEVSDGNHIYVLKRSKIKNKSAQSKAVKVGSQVEVEIANDGLIETKDVTQN